MKKLAVDGLPRFEIDELAAESIETAFKRVTVDRDKAVEDHAAAVKDSRAKLAAKDAEIAEKEKAHKAAVEAKDAEIKRLTEELTAAKGIDVDALVNEKTAVITDAKKLAPELEAKGAPAQIRRAALTVASSDSVSKTVIESFIGDIGLIEKADDGNVKSAFDLLVKLNRDAVVTAQDRAVAAAVSGNNSAVPAGGGEVFGDDDGTTEASS